MPNRPHLLGIDDGPFDVTDHLYAASAGSEPARAAQLLAAARRKGELPEPLRLAHLIAAALATGESRGRA